MPTSPCEPYSVATRHTHTRADVSACGVNTRFSFFYLHCRLRFSIFISNSLIRSSPAFPSFKFPIRSFSFHFPSVSPPARRFRPVRSVWRSRVSPKHFPEFSSFHVRAPITFSPARSSGPFPLVSSHTQALHSFHDVSDAMTRT